MRQGFSVPREYDPRFDSSFYLIVIGDDIENLTLQGYINGGLRSGDEMDATADMARHEAVLNDVFRRLLNVYMEQHHVEYGQRNFELETKMEIFYRTSAALLDYAISPETAAESRHQIFFGKGWLEDIFSHAFGRDRVFYLTAEITLPAGQSVSIQADMVKPGSYDFPKGSPNIGVYGYSMLG